VSRARAAALGAAGAGVALLLAGCDGPQSTLDPAGRDAERIAGLFWWMLGGALVVWTVVIGLAVYSIRVRPGSHPHRAAVWIIGGGAAFPTVVLAVLLTFGLGMMPEVLALPPEGGTVIEVSGEQWWWRVRYLPGDDPTGQGVELANEIRLPVGERLELRLTSPDVIHSFWVPSLSGKMDMIPGRETRIALEPTRTGVFHGVCAEYCGESHALMGFRAVVMEPDAYAAWLARQAGDASPPATPVAAHGADLFLAHGCGACHAVRGTPADGGVGPDLTHVASRASLAAGALPPGPDALRRWLGHPDAVKPGVHMPAFGMLPPEDLEALAAYLDSLE
jgi:cytochrome c oxidase subunit II